MQKTVVMGKYTLNLDCSKGGQSYIFDNIAGEGTYEPPVHFFLKHILKPDSAFIDIGAHIGYFATLAAGLMQEKGIIIAAEASPENVEYMKRHFEANGLASIIKLYPHPVSSTKGKVEFYFSAIDDVIHSLYDHQSRIDMVRYGEKAIEKKIVESVTLDQMAAKIPRKKLAVVKIDTEGGEHDILKGGQQFLKRSGATWIVAELNTYGLNKMGSSEQKIRRFMHEIGYETFLLDGKGQLPQWIPIDTRLRFKYVSNILFARMQDFKNAWSEIKRDA